MKRVATEFRGEVRKDGGLPFFLPISYINDISTSLAVGSSVLSEKQNA